MIGRGLAATLTALALGAACDRTPSVHGCDDDLTGVWRGPGGAWQLLTTRGGRELYPIDGGGLCPGDRPGAQRGFSNASDAWVFAVVCVIASTAGALAVRRRAQREAASRILEEREAHLRSIFDTAPEAMIVINDAGIIQSYGAAAEKMFAGARARSSGAISACSCPSPSGRSTMHTCSAI